MRCVNATKIGKACKRMGALPYVWIIECECGKWIDPWTDQYKYEHECHRINQELGRSFKNLEQERHHAFAYRIQGILVHWLHLAGFEPHGVRISRPAGAHLIWPSCLVLLHTTILSSYPLPDDVAKSIEHRLLEFETQPSQTSDL